jgi:hypothetical protein
MMQATISADVISYTSLHEKDKRHLETSVKQLLGELTSKFKAQQFYGRMVQGDYIECALNSPVHALRIALLLKSFVKSLQLNNIDKRKKELKYFLEHGIRLAVAVAPLTKIDPANGIIDGEAIYLSGRAIKSYSTSDKKRIIIKSTLFFRCTDERLQEPIATIFALLDFIFAGCSARQCEVIFYKLQGFNEKEIALKTGKYQSTISQHSTSAGWNAIENAVTYFEKTLSEWN